MRIVIDANELFSLMIQGSKSSKEIFMSKNIELIAPEFILNEFENNKKIHLIILYPKGSQTANLVCPLQLNESCTPQRFGYIK